jgi:hypothetical protein
MCGDLETQDDSTTLATYRGLAARHLRGKALPHTVKVIPGQDLPSYMSGLFQSVLSQVCVDATSSSLSVDNTFLIAQSVVLARAAGVLAAQLHLSEDPLRQVIEALMEGYASENGGHQQIDLDHHHHGPGGHDHDHGHSHDHDHHHHGGHGH